LGKYPPATRFTYDSDRYIEYLSYLLDARAPGNQTALQFAQQHFTSPLGLPSLCGVVALGLVGWEPSPVCSRCNREPFAEMTLQRDGFAEMHASTMLSEHKPLGWLIF
jgi:hypothetical protein